MGPGDHTRLFGEQTAAALRQAELARQLRQRAPQNPQVAVRQRDEPENPNVPEESDRYLRRGY